MVQTLLNDDITGAAQSPIDIISFLMPGKAAHPPQALVEKRKRGRPLMSDRTQLRERAIALRKEGWTEHAIVDNLGVPETTLSRWLRSVFAANAMMGSIKKVRTLTPERQQLKERAIVLRKQGWTIKAIGESIGISPGTLNGWFAPIRSFLGHERPRNKGQLSETNYILREEAKRIMAGNAVKLTVKQIYMTLVKGGIVLDNHDSYPHFCELIRRECRCGRLDGNLIREGRGGSQAQKFPVGAQVRITGQNKNTPLWLRQELRLSNCRTIRAIAKGEDGHLRYFLGVNRKGESYLESHSFRSDELAPYIKKNAVGRPRSKRKYVKKSKDTSVAFEGNLANSTMSPSISCVNRELCLIEGI